MRIFILFITAAGIFAFSFKADKKMRELRGSYQYVFSYPDQVGEMVIRGKDSVFLRPANLNEQVFTLSFDSGFVYYEDHENFQCFANMPDFGGHYRIGHDTLYCQREGLALGLRLDKNRDVLPIQIDGHGFGYDTVLTFLIRNDTLFSLCDKKIKPVKQPGH